MQDTLLHILLVEDDDDHAAILLRTLRQSPATTTVDRVADGAEAIDYLRQQGGYSERPRPDIVLLDLNLPKISGHEVLTNIKQDEQLRSIPVIVLTTSDADSDRARAYQSHANSYLVKPLDFSSLHQMMRDMSDYWFVWHRPAPV